MYEIDNLFTGGRNVLGGPVPAATLRVNYKLGEIEDGHPMDALPVGGSCLCVGRAVDAYVHPSCRRRAPAGSLTSDGHMVFVVRRVA